MFRPFNLFRLFDIFRSPQLGQSSAPRVTINALGEATITCSPRPGPRVVIDSDGLATVSCSAEDALAGSVLRDSALKVLRDVNNKILRAA